MIAARPSTLRRRTTLGTVFLLLVLLAPGVLATPPAQAASFRAGMIISDGVFYNSSSMSAGQIQTFLDQKGSACRPGSTGTPCLRDFRETTWTRTPDTRCTGQYTGAANESAATIIAKVATACRINPQVLLVLLQKEQGLITASGEYLTPRRYQAATGYGCPDTAPCDAEFRGFYNQVYKAAWQFRSYALTPYSWAHVPGRTSQTIALHPSATCGKVNVYIENQATAGLYNYTPYTPNSPLLNGRPDGCSSYGNLNFFNFFTEWFGSTQYQTSGAIGAVWQANSGLLGAATGNERPGLAQGGSMQNFANGTVYWSPSAGAYMVRGGVLAYWGTRGWENGTLGYPTTNEKLLSRLNGTVQSFQGGHVYWSPAGGPQVVLGAMSTRWASMGWESGPLGYPITSEKSLRDGGAVQAFEGGHIYYSPPYGAHAVRGGIYQAWAARGWEQGLGYPTVSERGGLVAGGSVQSFERGAIYWTPAHGTKAVSGAILSWWGANGWENGRLGYPTSAEVVSGATIYQTFERGRITYNSATGNITVR